MLSKMFSSDRPQHSSMLSERLLITRIITSLAVIFLLVLGVWAAIHPEPESAGWYTGAVAVVGDQSTAPPDGETMTAAPLGADAVFGAVTCLLGVLCGLVLIARTVRLLRRMTLREMSVSPPHVRIQLTLPGRPHAAALTLAQLGLSRT